MLAVLKTPPVVPKLPPLNQLSSHGTVTTASWKQKNPHNARKKSFRTQIYFRIQTCKFLNTSPINPQSDCYSNSQSLTGQVFGTCMTFLAQPSVSSQTNSADHLMTRCPRSSIDRYKTSRSLEVQKLKSNRDLAPRALRSLATCCRHLIDGR